MVMGGRMHVILNAKPLGQVDCFFVILASWWPRC